MDIKIVASQADILSAIADLNKIIFSDRGRNEHYPLEEYQIRLNDKKYFIYTAWADDRLIGNSLAYVVDNNLYLWVVGVAGPYQRQGIGTKFLEIKENLARQYNLSSLTSKVHNFSPEMQSLLEKNGYLVYKIEPHETDRKYDAKYYIKEITQ